LSIRTEPHLFIYHIQPPGTINYPQYINLTTLNPNPLNHT